MRPIKFRAWDKLEKRMSTVKALYFDEESVRVTDSEYDIFPFSQFELMQFVGILDVRWVEIYEGDIVRAIAEEEYKENTVIGDIFSDTDDWMRFCIRWEQWYDTWLSIWWEGWQSIKVIGNIHKNPELLNS